MQGTYLVHHGIKGQKWGVRRYQNEDGSLTEAGHERYINSSSISQPEMVRSSNAPIKSSSSVEKKASSNSSSISQPKMVRSSNAPIKSSSSVEKKAADAASIPGQVQTTKASSVTQTKLPSSTKTSTQSAGSTKTGSAKTESSTSDSSGSKKKKGKKSADKTVKQSGRQKVAHIKQSSSSKNGRSFVVRMSSPKSIIKSSSNSSATSYSSQGDLLIPRGR